MPRGTRRERRPDSMRPWHALNLDDVEAEFRTSQHGLSRAEAAERLAEFGPNALPAASSASSLIIFGRQFRSPLIYILIVAGAVTTLLQEFVDTAVVGAAIALNAVIGFLQERRAEQAMRALQHLLTPHARVIREGREWDIDSAEVVPGDVVLLESGSRVAADMRLFSATSLAIDESLLTGESVTVVKAISSVGKTAPISDRVGMAYAGTIVASGRGRGYVTATANWTELGQIAEEVRIGQRAATPMQERTEKFARVIGMAVLATSAASFVIGLSAGENVSDMLLTAVALAVSAVPEGLPAAATISLAIGVRRMASRNALIRRLAAAETLGSTTVIGSDKTGTLTENRMTVLEVWTVGEGLGVSLDFSAQQPASVARQTEDPAFLVLLCGVLTNEAEVFQEEGEYEFVGDPTEAALLVAAERAGLDTEELRENYRMYAEVPFEAERQFSASFRDLGDERYVFVKGAPERLLDMSRTLASPSGEQPLDSDLVHDAASVMAAKGLRVLAMAYRRLGPAEGEGGITDLDGLTFLGLQGMMDPPRAGVAEAIAGCRAAGVRVVMITGDHPATARAIGGMLGIDGDLRVLTGDDLQQMDDERLRHEVAHVPIFARVSPQDKLRIVRTLQERGDVVAVTGDGVNDAPALKAADIGISMGKSGTDVAREAADMVLADDNFVSIYAAVEEGRATFDNVRRVTFFLVSTGAAEVFLILASLVLGWPVPLLPAQILWLNVVTNGLQDVALAFEPKERGLLKRPPLAKNEGLLSQLLWERIALSGIVMGLATLLIFRWTLNGDSLDQARTMALTTMVVFQTFHIGNSRSERLSAFQKNPFSNPFLFVSAALALAVHIAALYLAPTQYVLDVEPIGLTDWLVIVAVASTIIVAIEAEKMARRLCAAK